MAWINDYTPLHLDLLQSLENTINNLISELEYDNNLLNSIQLEMDALLPAADRTRAILEELNEIIKSEYIVQKNTEIENINLKRGIIAFADGNQPIFNNDYYPEFNNNNNQNFSRGSIWFILN